jgi:hypothetical protein
LGKECSLELSRFLIENRDSNKVVFNDQKDSEVREIKQKLISLLPEAYINFTPKVQKQIKEQIEPVISSSSSFKA